jgi:hypothetical protein
MSYFAGITKVVDHSKSGRSTSALGHKWDIQAPLLMSALLPKADIVSKERELCRFHGHCC